MDLMDVWGLPHLNKVIIKDGNRIPNGDRDLIESLGQAMFSIRGLIDVWGLPHLNIVGIKYKEIEFQMVSSLIS